MKSGISQARFNYRVTSKEGGDTFLWISGTDSDIVAQALFNKGIKSRTGSKKGVWKEDGKPLEEGSLKEGRIILTPQDMITLKAYGGLDTLFKELVEQHTPKPEFAAPFSMYAQELESDSFLPSEGAASEPNFDLQEAHQANEEIVRSTIKLFAQAATAKGLLNSGRPAEKLSRIAALIADEAKDQNLLAIKDVLIAAGNAQNAGHFAEVARDPGESEKYLSQVRLSLSTAHQKYPTVSIESVVGAVMYATCMYGNNFVHTEHGPIEQVGRFTKATTSQVCRYLTMGLQQSPSVPSFYGAFSQPAFLEEIFAASDPFEEQSAAAAAQEPVAFKFGSLVNIGHLMHAANIVLRGEAGDKTITAQQALTAKNIFTHFHHQQTALQRQGADIIAEINTAFSNASVVAQKPIKDLEALNERVDKLQTSLGEFSLQSKSSSFLQKKPDASPEPAAAAAISTSQSKGQHQ